MASKDSDKSKDKDKAKPKPKPAKPEAKEKDKPKPKAKAKDAPEAAVPKEAKEEKPKEAPRPPADPRLKVLKKFHGKFLPRGPLRDRHKVLMQRWNSGDDHGGVTHAELKSLHEDWKTARARPVKKTVTV